MTRQIERRQPDRAVDEALSPEYLRVLEVCGGEIRQADRDALAGRQSTGTGERRKSTGTVADRRAEPPAPAPHGRGFTS
jgi:hypothetical protein